MKSFISCGIDIGTTTLSAVVLDITQGKQIEAFTREHNAYILSDKSYERIQDADKILSLAAELLDSILVRYPDICAIGVTGQMHGILYTDANGNACSPLYTWQDARGEYVLDEIKSVTSLTCASGYGLSTHLYNLKNHLIPDTASCFCSIMDYLVMKLTGNCVPICHSSVAASFGIYDIEKNDFARDALINLGISTDILPCVAADEKPIGEYKGIPVTVALGDNQASVFGSVRDEDDSVLVNYGTGSQVSVITDKPVADASLEVRPYIGTKNIICGCALCGGYAYQVLEGFFEGYSRALGIEGNQYALMDKLAEKAYYSDNKEGLTVTPFFKGTRQDPSVRGRIEGLSTDNFNAGNLILATVEGMADELYTMYKNSAITDKSILVASGNGVRKNKVLQCVLADRFGMELRLLESREEAAMGAAMYSAFCQGAGLDTVKKCILYK